MSEMVERVARAMADDAVAFGREHGCGPAQPLHWSLYERQARAAIEAMREPTREMVAACDAACWQPDNERLAIGPVYRAMIDAALT